MGDSQTWPMQTQGEHSTQKGPSEMVESIPKATVLPWEDGVNVKCEYLLFRVFLFVLFVFIYNVFTRFTLQCLSCGCKSFLTCCLSVCRFDLTLNVAVWTFIYLIETLPVHEIWAWVCYWAQHCIQFLVINILVSTIWCLF